jgi:hypothetical protein
VMTAAWQVVAASMKAKKDDFGRIFN